MDVQTYSPETSSQTKAGLTSGTTTTLTQSLAGGATSNIIAIRGKLYSVTALSNTASPTTDWATGNAFTPILVNQGSVFMVGFDHSGNLRAVQGQVTALDVSGNFIVAPNFGGMGPSGSGSTDQDFCPVAYVVVKAGSTASTWTFGASNWNATGITTAFQDICSIPDRPQVS